MEMFINGLGCVAPQDTKSRPLFKSLIEEPVLQTAIIKPNYRDYIAPAQIRRMGNAIKMGVVACKDALTEANVDSPDAIIAGTGLGCQQDSEKFLENILKNDEQFLTPTSFIQSTHNTVAGAVALMLKCNAYNFTYCHRGFSFENSLVDAQIMFEEGDGNNILVMGIDEITEHTRQVFQRINYNVQDPVNPLELVKSKHKGTVYGEGANSFVLSNKPGDNCYGSIAEVEILYKPTENEVIDKLNDLASKHEVDVVLAGFNGDEKFDSAYPELEPIFPKAEIGAFKHLVGEYHTASSFAVWLAAQVLKDQEIPSVVSIGGKKVQEVNNVLIYNHYNNLDHSFILIKK
ncbi:MAG: beta-ketoacyl synthase chain length factor [Salibacteraceae bacterium]